MNLVLKWEELEKKNKEVNMPAEGYKWNELGLLYENFYKEYSKYKLEELKKLFESDKNRIITLIEGYTDEELFKRNQRKWAASSKSNWPICKWIHINTVAPFKSFRGKIRKWKKLRDNINEKF